jgi:hypothetical protein
MGGWSLPSIGRAQVRERLQQVIQGARAHVPLSQRLYRGLPEHQSRFKSAPDGQLGWTDGNDV